MIQFRRGSTSSWQKAKTKLAAGQPGYDKEKHKIKIGDGENLWQDLPYASGLSATEILDSEESAKARNKLDAEDKTLITYGTEAPDKNTVGQVYLQAYDAEPETDYIVKSGINGIWSYQQWKSGFARCWGTLPLTTSVNTSIEGTNIFNDNNKMQSVKYPITFKSVPTEVATLHSPGGIAWLASKGKNTTKASGIYAILSLDEQITNADYSISIQVEGSWR
jgi:hypothetical protein